MSDTSNTTEKQLSFLEDKDLHKRLIYGTSILALGVGGIAGFFSSLRRFGKNESLKTAPGGGLVAAKAFLGGTVLCLASAAILVQSVKAYLDVKTVSNAVCDYSTTTRIYADPSICFAK
jgi:hypothetical protein